MVVLHFNVLIVISVVIIGLLVWNLFLWREISKLDKDLRWWRNEAVRLEMARVGFVRNINKKEER